MGTKQDIYEHFTCVVKPRIQKSKDMSVKLKQGYNNAHAHAYDH